MGQAKHRHKGKGLQLEIGAKNRNGGLRKADQDDIHAHLHHRADGLHDNAGQANGVNIAQGAAVEAEAPQGHLDGVALGKHDHQGHNAGQNLADDGGNGGTLYPHGGAAQQAKNHNGVQNQVGDGTGEHKHHGPDHVAGGLQNLFNGNLQKHTKGEDAHHRKVIGAPGGSGGVFSKGANESAGEEKAEQQKHQVAAHGQHNAVAGGAVGGFAVAFAQAARNKRVKPHAGANRNRGDQHLDGKGQRDGGEGTFAQLGHKNAVHNVVKGLHQHGKHGGYGHRDDQLGYRCDRHFVLFLHLEILLAAFAAFCHNIVYSYIVAQLQHFYPIVLECFGIFSY